MEQQLLVAGIILVILGFILIMASSLLSGDTNAEAGGVVFIGPIPVVFGSSKGMVLMAAVIGLVMLALLLARNGLP